MLGVLDVLRDWLMLLLLGDRALTLAEVAVLAFLCHLAIGALVMGMSSFNKLCMSVSKLK